MLGQLDSLRQYSLLGEWMIKTEYPHDWERIPGRLDKTNPDTLIFLYYAGHGKWKRFAKHKSIEAIEFEGVILNNNINNFLNLRVLIFQKDLWRKKKYIKMVNGIDSISTPLISLQLGNSDIIPPWVFTCHQLEYISFDVSNIANIHNFSGFEKLKSLKFINMHLSEMIDSFPFDFAQLKQLRGVNLVGEKGLPRNFGEVFSNLEYIMLDDLAEADMGQVSKMKELKFLGLYANFESPAPLINALKELKKLKYLQLSLNPKFGLLFIDALKEAFPDLTVVCYQLNYNADGFSALKVKRR